MAKNLKKGELGLEPKVDRLASTRLRKRLEKIEAIPKLAFSRGRIEEVLLKRTRGRFSLTGETAQKDPSGRRWKKLSTETRKPGGIPILVRSGSLRDSITIVRNNMRSEAALSSPTGAGFRIGVPATSPAAPYARLHQLGGVSGVNRKVRTPKRRFLGVGEGDIKAINKFIDRVIKEQLFG